MNVLYYKNDTVKSSITQSSCDVKFMLATFLSLTSSVLPPSSSIMSNMSHSLPKRQKTSIVAFHLTLVMLNKFRSHFYFQPIRLFDPCCWYKFTCWIEWQTMQIKISWLLQKPTDLDLHCLPRQGISGFIRKRVKRCKMSNSNYPKHRHYHYVFRLVYTLVLALCRLNSERLNHHQIKANHINETIFNLNCLLSVKQKYRKVHIYIYYYYYYYYFLSMISRFFLSMIIDQQVKLLETGDP